MKNFPGVTEPDVPDFQLYRQDILGPENFSIHCEPLYVRSSSHRWEIGLHRHNSYFQLFIITRGEGDFFIDNSHHRFKAPVALFVPAGAIHGFRFFAGSDGQVVTALTDHIHKAFDAEPKMVDFFSTTRVIPFGPAGETRGIADMFDRITVELAGGKPGNIVSSAAILSIVLVRLARAQLLDTDEAREPLRDRDTQRMQALEVMIARNFRDRQPVSFYAEQFGLSVQHLNRISRAGTGCTVQELIARRIIVEAKRLLTASPAPVREVVEALGFSDHAYFSRFFVKQVGMAPGRWRNIRPGHDGI